MQFTLNYNNGTVSAMATIAYDGLIDTAINIQNALTTLLNFHGFNPANYSVVVLGNSNTSFTIIVTGSAAVGMATFTGGFTDTGTGVMQVNPGNTFTGSVAIDGGILNSQNTNGLGINTSSVQQVSVIGGSSGSFTLQFGTGAGSTTASLQDGATAAQVQTALDALATISPNTVQVTQVGNAYLVYFNDGTLAHEAQPHLVPNWTTGIQSVNVSQVVLGGNSTINVASGATLQFQSLQSDPVTYFTESSFKPLTINGLGFNNQGALENVSGNNTWNDTPITLAGPSSVGADGTSVLTINQQITDGGNQYSVDKFGTGTVIYTGTTSNTYTGATNVYAGLLELNKTSPALAVEGNLTAGDATPVYQVQTVTFTGFQQYDVYTLTYNGLTTGNITFYGNPTYEAAAIQTALNQALGAGFVTVAPAASPNAYLVTFVGLGATNPAATIAGSDSTNPIGTTVFSAITTFGARPVVNSAIAQLEASNEIATTAQVTVNGDGLFDLNNFSQTIVGLDVNGGTATTGAGSSGGADGDRARGGHGRHAAGPRQQQPAQFQLAHHDGGHNQFDGGRQRTGGQRCDSVDRRHAGGSRAGQHAERAGGLRRFSVN